MASDRTHQLLSAAAAACEDKKAEDIRILALDPTESGLTDYFLICNGTNERQNLAISDEIELKLKREFGEYAHSVEGRRQAEWILLDYTDFIVHVFSPEKRAFYGLERLRKSATTLSVEDLNAELKKGIVATREKAPAAPRKTAKKAVAKKALGTKAAAKDAAVTKAAAKKAPATAKKAVAKKAAAPAKKAVAKKAAAPAKGAAKKAAAKKTK